MTTQPTHTPTPWIVRHGEKSGDSFLEIVHTIAEKNDYFVCRTWGTRPEDEANIALIARAVNTHQLLVDFMKDIIRERGFMSDAEESLLIEAGGLHDDNPESLGEACARLEGK